MKRILLFIIVSLCCLNTVYGGKTQRIKAEYTYHAPENVSVEQARQTAYKRAVIQGLADTFGQIFTQRNIIHTENKDGESSTDGFFLSESDVRGKWLRDISAPVYSKPIFENNQMIITAKVEFEGQEISGPDVDFEAKILNKGTDDSYESNSFKNGDDLYLSFRTPRDGYLAVYLVEGKQAYCLLPYRNQTDGICQVKANKRYVFFSQAEGNGADVDEYVMYTEREKENNTIYVIFSPNEFSKALDTESNRKIDMEGIDGLPRELPFEKLEKWLSKNQGRDNKMSVKPIDITIRK